MNYAAWDSIRQRPGVPIDVLTVEAALVAYERATRAAAVRVQRSAEREGHRARLAAEDYAAGRSALAAFWNADAQRLYAQARQIEACARAAEAADAVEEWIRAHDALDALRRAANVYGRCTGPSVGVHVVAR